VRVCLYMRADSGTVCDKVRCRTHKRALQKRLYSAKETYNKERVGMSMLHGLPQLTRIEREYGVATISRLLQIIGLFCRI